MAQTGQSLDGNQRSMRARPVLARPASEYWNRDTDLEEGKERLTKGQQWRRTLVLAFQTLGIIYGDIGTSPLYVFSGIFDSPPSEEDVVGAVSLIIYTITIVVMIKYALIVLRADDNGQGGSFALYAQLRRQGTLRAAGDKSVTDNVPNDWRQRFIEHKHTQIVLRVMVVAGVGLIIGDGVLTPAVSVVSACEGIQNSVSAVTRPAIVGISIGILIALFFIQSWGTAKVGFMFSPITSVWFAFNSIIGIINIVKYNPTIFKAVSPTFWFRYFLRNGQTGWSSLAGVFLCVTGAEALFADLGHFNRHAIQLGLFCVVWPSLILTYLGQAAYLTKNPQNVSQTFWRSLPGASYWPMFVVATAAAIVASQALISATFQIVRQAINQGFFPRFRVKHTSDKHEGQVYIAVMNYTLMVLVIIIVATFQTSVKITKAYGLAVVLDMCLTTTFLTLVLITVWRVHLVFPIAFALAFALVDGTFLSANATKVPTGGWFSLTMGGIFAYVMLLHFWGLTRKNRHLLRLRKTLEGYFRVTESADANPNGTRLQHLQLRESGVPVQQLSGLGIYYSEAVHGLPEPLVTIVEKFPVLPRMLVFLTNRFVALPRVHPEERFLVEQLGVAGFYHVIARYGYLELPDQGPHFVEGLLTHILSLLFRALQSDLSASSLNGTFQGYPLSAHAKEVINSNAGDLLGAGLTTNSLTLGSAARAEAAGLSLSLSLDGNTIRRAAAARLARPSANPSHHRPSIVDHDGNMVWPPNRGDESAQNSHTAGMPPPIAEGVATTAGIPVAAPARAPVLTFEDEMKHYGLAVTQKVVERDAPPPKYERIKLLSNELALVSDTAQEGVRAYVVGRSHPSTKLAKNPLRQYLLQLPFSFLVNNTDKDIAKAYGVPVDKLIEVGVAYDLA